jgi:hypothetical protein
VYFLDIMCHMTHSPPITVKADPAGYALRLPRDLYEQVKVLADEQGLSVNTLLVALIAGGIGWKLSPGQDDRDVPLIF